MKRLLFCVILFISTLSFAQTQKITPEFRAVIPGISHGDPIIYYYPGKFGGYDTLVNLNYLRSHFAALNDSLVFSNWFTGLGTVVSPLYIKRDSIFHLTAGTNISITGTAPNYIINAAGGSSLTGPGYVKMVSGSTTYITSIPNADLANAYVTVNGSIVNLGSAITITAATQNALSAGWGINSFSFDGSSAGIQVKADTSSGKLATQYYASVVVGADGIVTGLVTTTVTTTATTTAGIYRLNNALITKSTSTNTTIPAQDATLNRYTLIVGDASGVFTAVNGTLAADAVEPDIPANKALIASIYIPAVGGTTTTTGGGSGKGTVTKVTSSTTDILVANQTTTPILTLNKVNGVPITFYDPTSSIQTQLNGKQATLVSGTNIKTINSGTLLGSGNILLQTPLTAGTDYLAPTGSAAGLTGLTSGQVTGALGFTPENAANKSTTTTLGTSNTLYPTQNAVKTYVDNAVSGSGFSNPMTTTGDIIYSSSGSTPARLAIGGANTLLHGGTTPSYSAIVNGDITTGTIDFTKFNPTLPANFDLLNNGKSFSFHDSLSVGTNIAKPSLAGKNIIWSGDSFIAGGGASPTGLRFSTQFCVKTGATEVNHGTAGLSLGAAGGGGTMVANLSTYIPTKGVNDKYLVICIGQNDININTSTYFEANFAADYVTLLNYANSHGFTGTDIILMNISFNWTPQTTTTYATRQDAFSHAVDSLATVYGTQLVDLHSLTKNTGATILDVNFQHLNNVGQAMATQAIYNVVYPAIVRSGQSVRAPGTAEFQNLLLKKLPYSTYTSTAYSFLLIDTLGNTYRSKQLPANVEAANGMTMNGTFVYNGFVPISGVTLGVNDFGFVKNSRILTSWGGSNLYTSIELADAGNNMNIRVLSPGKLNIYGGASGTTLTTSFNADGTTTFGGNMIFNALDKKIQFDNGGSYHGGIILAGSNGATTIFNSIGAGFIPFLVSNGSDGGSLEAGRFTKLANFLLGGTVDNGIKLDVTGNGRFSTGLKFGTLLASTLSSVTPSTSGGTIAAGAHYYVVFPVDATGGIGPTSNEIGATNTGSTSSNAIAFTAVSGAVSYRIYVGTATGAENQYLATANTSITDIGSGYTSGALPVNTSSLASISGAGIINSSAAQTTVNASTSGTVVFSQPYAGTSDKKVVAFLNAANGTATYTFPTAFVNTPKVTTGNSALVTSLSTTAMTVTGATTTDTVILEAY